VSKGVFNNFVNTADASAFVRRATKTPRWLVGRVSSGADQRSREAWAHTQSNPIHWFDIPAVLERQNRLVSGDPAVDYVDYICATHLAGRSQLTALSLGCGTGAKELRWGQTGLFTTVSGFDFAQSRIELAQERTETAGLGDVMDFRVADVFAVSVEPQSVDVVLFDDSLHHFKPVRKVLENVRGWLKPDGLLVVREFVGPRAFQWPDRHVEAANGLLALLPPRLRTHYVTGKVKTRVSRPSRLRMRLTDPSEAAESDLITGSVHDLFGVVEEFQLGGTIVHLATMDIAFHFANGEPDSARFLELMFDAEDALLESGDIPSDHMLIIARPR
jgi:ubiquinone/menaquinone biosynthesis C-methylase UbiE